MIKVFSILFLLFSVLGCGNTKEGQDYDTARQALKNTPEYKAYDTAVQVLDQAERALPNATEAYDKAVKAVEKAWQAVKKTKEWQDYEIVKKAKGNND